MRRSSPPRHAALAVTTILLAACDRSSADGARGPADAPTAPSHAHAAPEAAAESGSQLHQALAQVRAATSRYHSLDDARAAGWATRVTGCLSDPAAGGMGVHYADLSRFDATVDATRPEILVYAPGPGGRLRLVAVEYAVPLDAWSADQPPTLFGLPFHVNAAFGLWVLHAWVWAPNPAGTFADWNPHVACPAGVS